MPVIVLGELLSGFRAENRRIRNEESLRRFLGKGSVRILNVTEETALRYAEVDVFLRKNLDGFEPSVQRAEPRE